MFAIQLLPMKQKNIILIGFMATALVTTGCAEHITTHGQVIKTRHVEQIVEGQHRKEDVQYLLGSPSAVATFNKNTWYYLSEKKVSKSMGDEEVLERRVITVRFNDDDVVKEVTDVLTTDIPKVSLNKRVTPTYGQSLGILDQMIENIGPGSF
jgi:outer membrane protein assembly factor BamE (lipoprotein component of BamABCDE complex)